MLKTIVVYEKDVLEVLQFQVPEEGFDLMAAIREAALEYAASQYGWEALHEMEGLDLSSFMKKVPDFYCKKHGFEKMEGSVCSVIEGRESMVLKKGEIPQKMPAAAVDMTPEMKICDMGVQFGRICGVMETLGCIPKQVHEMAAGWAMEYLNSNGTDPFEFFEKKVKEL